MTERAPSRRGAVRGQARRARPPARPPAPPSLVLLQQLPDLRLRDSLSVQLPAEASGHCLEAAHGCAAETQGQGSEGSGGRQPGPETPLQPPPTRAAFSWPFHLPQRILSKPASGDGNGCDVLCPLLAAWPVIELARQPARVTPEPTLLQRQGPAPLAPACPNCRPTRIQEGSGAAAPGPRAAGWPKSQWRLSVLSPVRAFSGHSLLAGVRACPAHHPVVLTPGVL